MKQALDSASYAPKRRKSLQIVAASKHERRFALRPPRRHAQNTFAKIKSLMSDAPPNPTTTATFEAGLRELEGIVKQMEASDLSLEKAVELFERGTRLSAACRKQLAEVETRVEILMKRAGAAGDGEKLEPRAFGPGKP